MKNQEKTNEKAVYKLNLSCGRQGDLDGLFIAKKTYVEKLISDQIEVYFGEVLGKHSDIICTIEKSDITFVSDDPTVIKIIEEHNLENGFNPFEFPSTDDTEGETVLDIIEKRLGQ